jgi:ribosomal protein L7/L12
LILSARCGCSGHKIHWPAHQPLPARGVLGHVCSNCRRPLEVLAEPVEETVEVRSFTPEPWHESITLVVAPPLPRTVVTLVSVGPSKLSVLRLLREHVDAPLVDLLAAMEHLPRSFRLHSEAEAFGLHDKLRAVGAEVGVSAGEIG